VCWLTFACCWNVLLLLLLVVVVPLRVSQRGWKSVDPC